jgi:microcystin degradation protein MlrC
MPAECAEHVLNLVLRTIADRRTGQEFIAMRDRTAPDYPTTDEGIGAALAFNASPVVMADPEDNADSGAPRQIEPTSRTRRSGLSGI